MSTAFDDLADQTPAPDSLRGILERAKPAFDPISRLYHWWAGDPPDPASGVISPSLLADLVFLGRFTHYQTEAGAMAALATAVLRLERGLTRKDG